MTVSSIPLSVLILLFLAAGCAGDPMPDPSTTLGVAWEALYNPTAERPHARARLTLRNRGAETLQAGGWALYFNFNRLVDPLPGNAPLALERINGDFYRLTSGPAWTDLTAGDSVSVEWTYADAVIKYTDAPSGFYQLLDGPSAAPKPIAEVHIAPFTRPEQTTRGPADVMPVPTPASRFAANAGLRILPAGEIVPILPTPAALTVSAGRVALTGLRVRHAAGLEREAALLAELLDTPVDVAAGDETGAGVVSLTLGSVPAEGSGSPDEAYTLSASTTGGIAIRGASAAGVFYGIQSLRALIDPLDERTPVSIPSVTIHDAPRFAYRGMMIDVARHFHDAATLKRVIEALAFYKLNRLHLHLSDDEGWRLEIAGLPDLTEIGSRRGHTRDERDRLYPSLGSGPDPDISPGSGYFDRATFIDLLRFATDRHIEVIPEFDLPGHSRAAIRSMEERYRRLTAENSPEASTYRLIHPGDTSRYRSVQHWDDNVVDVCLPSTLAFVERVIDATVALYREAGAPLSTIHVGGDEVPPGVWMASPACGAGVETPDPEALKEAFFSRVYEILERHGLAMSGWEEMALHHSRDNTRTPSEALRGKQVRAYAWNSVWGWGGEDHAYRLANAGYDVVMSAATDLYFDLSYDKDPEEPGYYWAAFVDTYAPFAFQPFDIYRAARRDRMGHPLDPVGVAQSRERLSPEGRGHILGLQGQLWSERARDRGELEYLLFPKLLGLAERAWAPQPAWEQGPLDRAEALRGTAWNAFANRLGQRELPRLDHLAGGFAYRIPPPGVAEIDGTLQANTAFPGLTIRYSSDGTEPDAEDPRYEGPLPTDRRVRFRTFDTRGRGSRSAALVP